MQRRIRFQRCRQRGKVVDDVDRGLGPGVVGKGRVVQRDRDQLGLGRLCVRVRLRERDGLGNALAFGKKDWHSSKLPPAVTCQPICTAAFARAYLGRQRMSQGITRRNDLAPGLRIP